MHCGRRFMLLAFGQGRWENPEEAWRMAARARRQGRAEPRRCWGPDYDHDWPTWRQMLPVYLDQLIP